MEEQTKDLQDYLIAIRKRKLAISIIFSVIFGITLLVTFLLPSIYESKASILIEQQEIPRELVLSTVTTYAAERIQIIKARILSRTNLLLIADKFDLYKARRKQMTSEEIVSIIREHINIDLINADVQDPRSGRKTSATIAFSLSFLDESPKVAQRMASELTTLFLNENLKSRFEKAEETSEFFKDEVKRLSDQISEYESELAIFKQENKDALPELKSLNLQVLQRTEVSISSLDARLRMLEDKRYSIQGQLAIIQPENPAILSSHVRLKILESQYISDRAKYSDNHPDVQKLKREIDSLKLETGRVNKSDKLAEQLLVLRAELVKKKEQYTSEHPDVLAQERKIAALERELEQSSGRVEESYFKDTPDNPMYITLEAQLSSVESEMSSINIERDRFVKKLEMMEQRLFNAPQVEREYLNLMRDYENSVTRYRKIKEKQMKADVSKQLESESKGERFTLMDPAIVPQKPISPNRPGIIFLGLILALGSGFGFAFISDVINRVVRGTKSIEMLTGAKPLSVIPYQLNLADISIRKKYGRNAIITVFVFIILMLFMIHYFVSPLDVLWFRVMRKF